MEPFPTSAHSARRTRARSYKKSAAKLIARECFRNSKKLKDMHASHQIDDQEM
jgi:hypothetical protein